MTTNITKIFRILLDSTTDLDLPPEMTITSNYCATLGHKVMLDTVLLPRMTVMSNLFCCRFATVFSQMLNLTHATTQGNVMQCNATRCNATQHDAMQLTGRKPTIKIEGKDMNKQELF